MTEVTITKQIGFDAGHRVPKHQGKCSAPHGHRYELFVTCKGQIIETPGSPDEGMLVDFGHLKKLMVELISDKLDHKFILYEKDFDLASALEYANFGDDLVSFPYIPTAENIARWCWDALQMPIKVMWGENLWLEDVTVFETPTSSASYSGEEFDVEG